MTGFRPARIFGCASPLRPSSSVANGRQALSRAGFSFSSVAGSGNARVAGSGSPGGTTADTHNRRCE